MERKLYTADDRPELESLVHNLEHGYTILWYDETIADDDEAMDELRGDRRQARRHREHAHKFIAAPWTSDDEGGKKFPERPARRVHALVGRRRRARPTRRSRSASSSTAPTSPARR